MSLLTATEIRQIERDYREGISSGVVVELFKARGERFSEATLRKYVQLELLPKSKRVGSRGRHKGSSGLYPVEIVRLINDIKKALEKGATLEEIRNSDIGLSGEIQRLRRVSEQVLERFQEAIDQKEDRARAQLARSLEKHRRSVDRQIEYLEEFATRIGGADNRLDQAFVLRGR